MVTVMECSFFFFYTKGRVGFGVPCFILNVKCNEALMTAALRLLGSSVHAVVHCTVHTQEYGTESSICLG